MVSHGLNEGDPGIKHSLHCASFGVDINELSARNFCTHRETTISTREVREFSFRALLDVRWAKGCCGLVEPNLLATGAPRL